MRKSLIIVFLIAIIGMPVYSADFTPKQEKKKLKSEYYLKDHFYKALKPGYGVDVARKYAFYSVEEFNKYLDEGYSIDQSRGKAIRGTYKAINSDKSDYNERKEAYKQDHKAKYYAKRAAFWPLPIPSTMLPAPIKNEFVNKSTDAPTPVMSIPTGVDNVELLHPIDNPFTTPVPVYKN